MKLMLHEEKKNTRDEMLRRVLNAAEQIRNTFYVLERTIDSIINRDGKCIEVGAQFEHLLHV
jgi:hypothetical protein